MHGLIDHRGHTLITLAHKDTRLVSKSEQNANLINRLYLVNMLTRVVRSSMCFGRFLLAFESCDLSQADKSIKSVFSFPN